LPDLRYSSTLASRAAWNSVVIDGELTNGGMVSFKDDYSADELNAIRSYVIDQAQKTVAARGR